VSPHQRAAPPSQPPQPDEKGAARPGAMGPPFLQRKWKVYPFPPTGRKAGGLPNRSLRPAHGASRPASAWKTCDLLKARLGFGVLSLTVTCFGLALAPCSPWAPVRFAARKRRTLASPVWAWQGAGRAWAPFDQTPGTQVGGGGRALEREFRMELGRRLLEERYAPVPEFRMFRPKPATGELARLIR